MEDRWDESKQSQTDQSQSQNQSHSQNQNQNQSVFHQVLPPITVSQTDQQSLDLNHGPEPQT